ncbi:MAG: glycosyltransferase family 39 protein [Fulvimarina manganoxydans]|uniref:glycosyltransferase family 39 protein n=1 Tax=Fulvimarina manganoxydans TaxID=937218 RepID=UPI002355C9BD|nr:glycosyltransferase family 39 protein [Fulvimarina manganoxydans]MCK5930544.1 glycosyltransferase family 39 protein [Fulvimarina manganoxydans]
MTSIETRQARSAPSTLSSRLTAFADAVDRPVRRLSSARFAGVPAPLLAILAILAANFGLILLDGRPPSADDAEQLSQATGWALGYTGVQPPVHTWIVVTLQTLFGEGLTAVLAARWFVVSAFFVAMAGLCRALGLKGDALGAGLFGAFLLPQIGWEAQRTFSHSLSALLFSVLFIAILVFATRVRSLALWASLGFVAAFALLSKYNTALLIGCAFVAFASLSDARRMMPRFGPVAFMAMAVVILAAPVSWLLDRLQTLDDSAKKFAFVEGEPLWTAALGLGNYMLAIAAYVAPLMLVALLGLLYLEGRGGVSVAFAAFRTSTGVRLILRTMLLVLSIGLVLILASGATAVETYWLHPALVMSAPLVAFALDRADPSGHANRVVIAWGLVAALVTMLVFLIRSFGVG